MQNNPSDQRDQEIDLLYVIRRMKNSVIAFFTGVWSIITFTGKNALKLLAFIFVAMAVFALLYFAKRPYYSSAMTLTHLRVDNFYCEELVKSLDKSIDGAGNALLAEELKISPRLANEVKRLSFEPLNKQLAKRFTDSVTVIQPFKVIALVYTQDVLDSLQSGILSYFENNEFANKRKKLDLEAMSLVEERMSHELREIDSLKIIVNQAILPRASGNGIILGEPIDPVSVYRRAADVFDQRINIKKRQSLIDSFEIVVGFNKSNARADLPLLIYLLAGVVVGYLAGLIYLIPRRNNG